MSGTQVSSFAPANVLYDAASGTTLINNQNALLQGQREQQQIGAADVEMTARFAQTLTGMSEEDAARAYGPGIAYLQSLGFAKRAPPTFPGIEVAKRLAAMGVPAKDQYERAGNTETIHGLWPSAPPAPGPGATATPPAVPGGGATRPGGLAETTVEPETGLPVMGRMARAPSAAPGTTLADIHPNLTTIQSPNGAKLTVSADAAPRFQGLIDDLHAEGYTLDPATTGGYNARNIAGTNTPSQHAYGSAIDINWRRNQRGANTPSDIPPDLARRLAAKHGLTWGGDWKGDTRDPMHFEVANAAPQTPRGGVAARTGGTDVAGPGAGSAAPAAAGGGGREQFTAEQAHDLDVMARQLANKPGGAAAFLTLKNHYLEKNAAAAHQAFETSRQIEADRATAAQREQENRDRAANLVIQQSQEKRAQAVQDKKDKEAAAAAAAPEFTGEGPEMQRQHILRYGDPFSPGFHQAWAGEKQSRTTISPTGLVSTPSMSEFRAPLDKDGNPRTDLGEVKIRPGPSAAGIEAARVATVDHEKITSAIDHFTDLFKKQGGGSFQAWIDDPTSAPAQQINGAFTAMITTLRSPTYFNTGVLQPAEHAMLLSEGLSPKSWRGLFATPEAMVARLGEIKRAITVAKNVSRRVAGMEEEPDKAGPVPPSKEILYGPDAKRIVQ